MIRYTPDNIKKLEPNEIFVFGSNLKGLHTGGAARIAYNKFGAVWGVGVGLQGNSYAIPTMQGGVDTIEPYVNEFLRFAMLHQELTFYVTRIGCGIAGFSDEEVAPLFDMAIEMTNVILPKSFHTLLCQNRLLKSETSGLTFHYVPLKFFDEDIQKMNRMSLEEQNAYLSKLKEEGKYTIGHESPFKDSLPLLNTTNEGHHRIAITCKTFAVIADRFLYSNLFEWGLDLGQKILSVVAKDASEMDSPYGQFVVLLEDGSIHLIWSDSCIRKLSHSSYISVASGCGGLIFGLKDNGTVHIVSTERDTMNIAQQVKEWTNVFQIDAGPRHVVGVKSDGTVVAAGKTSACKPLEGWRGIKKIYISKTAPIFGKQNDLTFGIGHNNWLYIDGDYWPECEDFWKRIRAQYDVSDIIENGAIVWVRTYEGELRYITYYSKMNYWEEIEFVKKYHDCRFIESYGDITVIVDKDGEFRILYSNKEVNWWNMQETKF